MMVQRRAARASHHIGGHWSMAVNRQTTVDGTPTKNGRAIVFPDGSSLSLLRWSHTRTGEKERVRCTTVSSVSSVISSVSCCPGGRVKRRAMAKTSDRLQQSTKQRGPISDHLPRPYLPCEPARLPRLPSCPLAPTLPFACPILLLLTPPPPPAGAEQSGKERAGKQAGR